MGGLDSAAAPTTTTVARLVAEAYMAAVADVAAAPTAVAAAGSSVRQSYRRIQWWKITSSAYWSVLYLQHTHLNLYLCTHHRVITTITDDNVHQHNVRACLKKLITILCWG